MEDEAWRRTIMIAIIKTASMTFLTAMCSATLCLPVQSSKKDMELLNGDWQAQSMEIDGQAASPGEARSIRVTYKNDKLLVQLDPEYYPAKEVLYKIDSTKSPKYLDISPLDEPSESASGIYELDNDNLKVCLNLNSSAERPGEPELIRAFPKLRAIHS